MSYISIGRGRKKFCEKTLFLLSRDLSPWSSFQTLSLNWRSSIIFLNSLKTVCCSYFRCLRNTLFIILGGVALLSNAKMSHFTLNPLRAPNIWYFTYFRTLKPHKFRDNARGIRNIKRQGMIHKGMFKLLNLMHSLLIHISHGKLW